MHALEKYNPHRTIEYVQISPQDKFMNSEEFIFLQYVSNFYSPVHTYTHLPVHPFTRSPVHLIPTSPVIPTHNPHDRTSNP